MTGSKFKPEHDSDATENNLSLFDPRCGDAEDDISSPKQRSLIAIAGGLLAEIGLPKDVFYIHCGSAAWFGSADHRGLVS